MVRYFSRSLAVVLLLTSAFSFDHARADSYAQRCLTSVLGGIGSTAKKTRASLIKFSEEVKRDGAQRFFIKDLPKIEAVPETKLFGALRATEKSDQHWFWRLENTVIQWPSRTITKAVYGKAYDFAPVSTFFSKVERLVLPKGKTITSGWKMAGAVVLYPLTFYGLADRWLTSKEREKRVRDLDYLIDNDYRFREIKAKYGDSKQIKARGSRGVVLPDDPGLEPADDAYREAIELKAEYESYFAIMKELQKQGLSYDNPATTALLFADAEVVKQIGPLFTDVLDVVNPKFYEDKPFIDAEHLKPKTPEMVHDLMKLNHLKLMVEASSRSLLEDSDDTPANLKKVFEKDPFFQELKKSLKDKKITLAQAESAFDQWVEWNSRLKMFEVVGVTPYQMKNGKITHDVLHIGDLATEILAQVKPKKN
jgi:hypothetical protein